LDTHWAAISAGQGVGGQPTTWVHANASTDAIRDAMAAGHTFVIENPNGPALLLQAGGSV
jgi:hypothetical protein